MARGLALGWRQPVLCADVDSPRAQALAAEVGGEAVGSNAELAQRVDLVVLCHKPAQLQSVALEVAPHAQAIVSILAATPLKDVKAAYPGRPVYRVLPSTPVEVRQGAVILAADESQGQPILDARVQELFAELGTLVVLDDALIDVAMGLMSKAPAYYALVVEAQVDAGVRRGIPPRPRPDLALRPRAGPPAAGLRAGRADDGRHRRAAAPPRVRHARRPPRRHLAGRLDRARARRARARRPAGGVLVRDGCDPEGIVTFILAAVRDDIAGYVNALVNVYVLLIIAYILS